jgi:hypothetical protein
VRVHDRAQVISMPPRLVHLLPEQPDECVPVNVVQRVMGHEQASTTLNRYTHTPDDYGQRVRAAFDGPAPFRSLRTASQPAQRKRRDHDNVVTWVYVGSRHRGDERI